MKKTFLLCLFCTIFIANRSFAVTIDFENGSHKLAIPFDTYQDQGILIYGGSTFVSGQTGWDLAHSGSRGMYPTALTSTLDGTSAADIATAHSIGSSKIGEFVADIQFVIPGTTTSTTVNSFSLWIGFDPSVTSGEINRLIIEGFDSQNNRILDFTSGSLIGVSEEFHAFNAQDIARLRITNIDNVGIDDLTFSTVPIPTAAWLFASGLLGLVGIARRKRTA